MNEVLEYFGFIKKKHFRSKKNGVSSFSWYHGNSEILTIEKHHCGDYDEGETFYPTFRHSNIVVVIDRTRDLLFIMKILRLDSDRLDKFNKSIINMATDYGREDNV